MKAGLYKEALKNFIRAGLLGRLESWTNAGIVLLLIYFVIIVFICVSGCLLEKHKQTRKAIKCYREAAKAGLSGAQFNLGLYSASLCNAVAYCYRKGLLLSKGKERDFTEIAMWYEKAAEQGHLDATFSIGTRPFF